MKACVMGSFDEFCWMKTSEKEMKFDFSQSIMRVATGFEDHESEEEWESIDVSQNEANQKVAIDIEKQEEPDCGTCPGRTKLQSSLTSEGDFVRVEFEPRCRCRSLYNIHIGKCAKQ
eukprot:765424-Hanusia_phi.AAC.1